MSIDHLGRYLELEGLCPDPVFIIGSPRSGTTALGHALNKHPDLWASKECYVLDQLYGKGKPNQVWRHHQERQNPSWLRAEGVEREEFLGFLGLGLNALYSSRSNGRRWVDPTPLNTTMVDDLASMFPTASFLHIVRDGRFVVRSMGKFRDMLERVQGSAPANEVPGWTDDFRRACETWAEYVEVALRFQERHPERCMTIRNEDLEADPDAGFARIFEFLGAKPDDGPAAFFGGQRINSSFQDGAVQPSDSDWSGWEPKVRQVFAEIAGPTLIRAGYANPSELEAWAASGFIEPALKAQQD